MDNAQKAIMIGVGLFITIIIISAVLLITNIGTNLVNNAQNQMSGISTSLQNQVTTSFDGKTMSGSEVIAACQQYESSETISIRIIVNEGKQFETGKYAVTLDGKKLNDIAKAIPGGVEVSYTDSANSSYKDSRHDSLTTIQAAGGVSGAQRYYTNVMKDKDSGTVMGIIFVRVGASGDTAINEVP